MSHPDPVASAALGEPVIKPVFFVYLDIRGDPVRANTSGADITPTGTGDPELDGHLFNGISGDFVTIDSVSNSEGGTGTVTAELSGIESIDAALLSVIQVTTNWQSRPARLWRVIRNADNQQQGGWQPYYTGYMMQLAHIGSSGRQVLRLKIENYLAVLSQASGRTYADSEIYDPGDLSGRATVPAANGVVTGANVVYGASGGGGFGGGNSNPFL